MSPPLQHDRPPAPRWRMVGVAAAALVLLVALPLVPLPRACDPRAEEVTPAAYRELSRFAGTRSRAEIEDALRLVDPHQQLGPFLSLSDGSLDIRIEPGEHRPIVSIPLRTAATPADQPALAPWRRIALDPGHSGGSWSRLEQRHFRPPGGIELREGDLNWATARLVERQLRHAGLEVLLLRDPPPQVPFDATQVAGFDPGTEGRLWLADNHQSPVAWLSPRVALALWRERRRAEVERPFELFTRFELRRRAAAAGAFGADVTLSLHYNHTETGRNGVLVFVPGNFLPGELRTESQRYWALLRVLDGHQQATLALARAMGRALQSELELPASAEIVPTWLPVDATAGVYARNLAMGRRTAGVVLLLEGPPVNHPQEYRRLQGTELEVDGRRYPTRVQQYARAVVAALRAGGEDGATDGAQLPSP
jgi:N-acetylmuramoyl-L-alanine amidase